MIYDELDCERDPYTTQLNKIHLNTNKTMEIVTYLEQGDLNHRKFEKWKRKANGDWHFALNGEWSTMSGTFGKHRFYSRTSNDRAYWALKINGFPTRIVASAFFTENIVDEEILGQMIKFVENTGGEWIESVWDAADELKLDLFWNSWKRA